MQYSYIKSGVKTLERPGILVWLKSAIFLGVAFLIYTILVNKAYFDQDFISSFQYLNEGNLTLLCLTLALLPLNWGLESLKWKYLTRNLEELSFMEAYKGVLTGVCFGLVTPHGIGDYPGRVLQMKSIERIKGTGAVLISRITQFYITLVLGSISLLYIFEKLLSPQSLFFQSLLVPLFLLCNVLFLMIFIFNKKVFALCNSVPWFTRFVPYFKIVEEYDTQDFFIVILLAFLRYAVFALQFLLLFYVFNIDEELVTMVMGVFFIFLAKSIIPTFFDLGIRESSALYFFHHFSPGNENVLFASLTLWCINIVLPAILGMFLIFKIKLFTSK
ncbi:MAG TPA: lysylphosphatidylglycerol synthase transmembrane domain-containing protein [Cytophagaceae bacterium]|jgi:uncharacterized protein (TIRG00374 family)